MAKIIVDGIEYEVDPDNNLLQECLSQGLDLPYFCWHPCMGSVGACRQCAVKQYKDADDKEGMLVMSCMTPAADGSIISIEDEQAKDMRERVIESLMISHPHDCPVCEEGGECHLQDMTLMSCHNYRRYDKKKVTHRNQYLGPFINHEMNRCITCYRCVRFYNDYAGGTDLSAQASHHHTYFGRHEEGVLESEFSGNLVEVCPTGVFTDQAFSLHYSRKWDLQTAPSVCTGCAVGCNTIPGERYRQLRRVTNRYNSDINGYFICDRGRFGYDYVNSDARLTEPCQQSGGEATPIAEQEVQSVLDEFHSGEGDTIGIGSPRASTESNFALRCLVGDDNFYSGLSDGSQEATQLVLELARDKAFHSPSMREIEQADAVVILGEDITNVAPRIALALRQSVRNKAKELAADCHIPQWQDAAVRELAQHDRSPLAILSSYATRLDDVASDCVVDVPAALVDTGFAIAASLSKKAGVSTTTEHKAVAKRIAAQLSAAKRPLIIAGTTTGQIGLIRAAANIARALSSKNKAAIDLCLLVPEVNTLGVSMLANNANKLSEALSKLASGDARRAIVLENDLYRRADSEAVTAALSGAKKLLVIDQLPTATTSQADIVLPSTAFSEHEATYVNYEGRGQLSFQVHRNHSRALPAWRWLTDAEQGDVEAMINRCAEEAQDFDKLDELLPDVKQFVAGMKVPRQSHRYSGRTAMRSQFNVHEPKQPVDNQSVMSFSMEGIPSMSNARVLGAAWAPGWNSNQAISKFQDEINGELKQAHTGSLLIERTESVSSFYAPEAAGQESTKGALQVAPAYQIFGSDELSARSHAIQQRMTDAYVGISPEDADSLGLKQGDSVSLDGNGSLATLCIRSRIKTGTAAVYCGDNRINPHSLGATLTLSKSETISDDRGITGLIVSDLYEEDY
ncbi:MAG: NADH-quinone oxidoreductase subunit NuoG [Gammaproteobacteria bacterium]|nr:NADH-quinone oxidoreductase subunit NuoG [Gammaproteobacteria bacterium]